jgi:hypothetical protein
MSQSNRRYPSLRALSQHFLSEFGPQVRIVRQTSSPAPQNTRSEFLKNTIPPRSLLRVDHQFDKSKNTQIPPSGAPAKSPINQRAGENSSSPKRIACQFQSQQVILPTRPSTMAIGFQSMLSSVVEHILHTDGVAGSNPAACTIFDFQ